MQMKWRTVHVSARLQGPVQLMQIQMLLLDLQRKTPGEESVTCDLHEVKEGESVYIIAEIELDTTLPIEEIRKELEKCSVESWDAYCPHEHPNTGEEDNEADKSSDNSAT